MRAITPGVDFLVKGTFILSFPAFAAYVVGQVSERFGGTPVPARTLISTGFIIVPILAAARIVLTRLRHRREAAALGAKMVPCARGKWLGNADILKTMQHHFFYGYPGVYPEPWEDSPLWRNIPGDGLNEFMEERGPVINLRVFWSDLLFTASPEHLKLMLATNFENYVKGQKYFSPIWMIHQITLDCRHQVFNEGWKTF